MPAGDAGLERQTVSERLAAAHLRIDDALSDRDAAPFHEILDHAQRLTAEVARLQAQLAAQQAVVDAARALIDAPSCTRPVMSFGHESEVDGGCDLHRWHVLRATLEQRVVVEATRSGMDKQDVMRLAQQAINDSIRAHGPVTFDTSLSAAKRVAGQITTHYANLVDKAQAVQPEGERAG